MINITTKNGTPFLTSAKGQIINDFCCSELIKVTCLIIIEHWACTSSAGTILSPWMNGLHKNWSYCTAIWMLQSLSPLLQLNHFPWLVVKTYWDLQYCMIWAKYFNFGIFCLLAKSIRKKMWAKLSKNNLTAHSQAKIEISIYLKTLLYISNWYHSTNNEN